MEGFANVILSIINKYTTVSYVKEKPGQSIYADSGIVYILITTVYEKDKSETKKHLTSN